MGAVWLQIRNGHNRSNMLACLQPATIADAVIVQLTVYFSADVNYEELARCTDDFNGAQCKAVCVEAVSL